MPPDAVVSAPRPGIDPKWWVLAVTASGSFMAGLDGSVVNMALPIIGQTTRSPVSTVEWVILIYLITSSASLLLFGRLADIHGKRAIYMWGQFIFVIGSLCCGLSHSIGLLIASRAIQAVGAAMIFALSPAILISAFPASERGSALGMQATFAYMGLAIGPALGGFLTQHWGWPSIFFINVPIGLAMLGLAHHVLQTDRHTIGQPFDPAGAATLAIALASLLLVLSQGGTFGWSHPGILALAALAAISGAAFILIERHIPYPALDFNLFRNRRFSASIVAACLCYLSSASVSFLLPFYLLGAAGLTPSQAGLVMMAVPLAMMSVTGLSGLLSDHIGVRLPATLGMALVASALFLLGKLPAGFDALHTVGALLVMGFGVGLFTAPNNSAIMGSVPPRNQGVAGALLAAARTVGFAIGVALAGLIFTASLQSSHVAATPSVIAHAVRTGMRLIAFFAMAGAGFSLLRGTRPDD
jgi:EmrB/QacA subfamily drug resistance transporter